MKVWCLGVAVEVKDETDNFLFNGLSSSVGYQSIYILAGRGIISKEARILQHLEREDIPIM